MALDELKAGRTVTFAGAAGSLEARLVGGRALLFVGKGKPQLSFVDDMGRVIDQLVAAGRRPALFFDTTSAEGNEPRFRDGVTALLKRQQPNLAGVHILVGSKIISMAVSVSNMIIGGSLQMFSDRAKFEAALQRAARG